MLSARAAVPQFGVHEISVPAGREYANPYTDHQAEANITEPDGRATRMVPLFWDGGRSWRFRFSPDKPGTWKWTVVSEDSAQNGKAGEFTVEKSDRRGSLRPMRQFPHHFERQDGSRFWFMGDTAWAFFTDSEPEKHNRESAFRYVDRRAAQGFNVIHSMLLSEAGWGNSGGKPFEDIGGEVINPSYWQEVDRRLEYVNSRGLVCGVAVAWGDKQKREPYAWRKFPSVEARKRYARYVAARYSAYDVYFIVSGEWHGEIHTREGAREAEIRQEFVEIGDALHAADAHGRMKAIHPMTARGSVGEFNEAKWMTFGDYQQNYQKLHERVLEAREHGKPVVNSEYGYFLRDQSGDGVPDKDNSTSIESMRHAGWDIVMAGGYVVTGFGTTYFGGNRDPGPFDPEAKKNYEFERQMTYLKQCFEPLAWWKLQPADKLLSYSSPRQKDSEQLGVLAPPALTYWCLADEGKQYVLYVRGVDKPITLKVKEADYKAREFNPRTGKSKNLLRGFADGRFVYHPSDGQDWVVVLTSAAE